MDTRRLLTSPALRPFWLIVLLVILWDLSTGEEVRTFIDARYSVERVCAAWEDLVVATAGQR